jgi:hypothetical protein
MSCKKDNDSSTPTQPTSNVHLKSGLLLYLPFNGNIADSSGNGNQTTAVAGATLTYDEHGYANSAFGSTGNGERIKVANNGSIKFDTALSISLNFMQLSQINFQEFMCMVNPINGYGPSFAVGVGVLGSNKFIGMGVADSLAGCNNTGANGPNLLNDTTSYIPQLGSWYNLVATYHKGTMNIYINGKLISTKIIGSTKILLCPASQVVIGGWWDGDPGYFNGKLDEVRLYNRVLNSDEITELAKNFQQ